MEWHPFAEKLGWIDPEQWPAFLESIRATGGPEEAILFRLLPDGTRQGLDGRNRERACSQLGIPCPARQVVLDDAEVKDFILRRNLHRRHMTPQTRQAIVAELRADGMSLRQIAERLGVSHPTILADLSSGGKDLPTPGVDNSDVTNVTPEKVTGKDNKTYPATKPKRKKPQEQPDAPDEEQRHPPDDQNGQPQPADDTHSDADEGPPALLDSIGVRVPDSLATVFDPATEALRQKCLTLCRQLRDALHQYADSDAGAQLRKRLSRQGRSEDNVRWRSNELHALTSLIQHWGPYACICPYCHHASKVNRDCGACLGMGWCCEDAYENAPADYREAVALLSEVPF